MQDILDCSDDTIFTGAEIKAYYHDVRYHYTKKCIEFASAIQFCNIKIQDNRHYAIKKIITPNGRIIYRLVRVKNLNKRRKKENEN